MNIVKNVEKVAKVAFEISRVAFIISTAELVGRCVIEKTERARAIRTTKQQIKKAKETSNYYAGYLKGYLTGDKKFAKYYKKHCPENYERIMKTEP